MSEKLIVRTEHMRGVTGFSDTPGFCVGKSRLWFQRHGLDWRDFCRNGIDAEVLIATGDGMALAIVEHARKLQAEATDGR